MLKQNVHFNEHDRNQVIEKRNQIREIKRKRRRNAVVILLMIALAVVFLISDYSKVRTITVDGCHMLKEKDIIHNISIKKKETFFFSVNKKELQKEIEKMIFVSSATVKQSLSGDIQITIKENRPILYTYMNGELYVVDQKGNIQKDSKEQWLSYVQRCPQATHFDMASFKLFVKEYIKISSVVQNKISSIAYEDSVKDPQKIKFALDDGKIFYVRIKDMEKHLTAKNYYLVMQKYPKYKYYDFLGNHVYVYNS